MAKVKIRVRGYINSDGSWAVYGWNGGSKDESDEVLHDMMSDEDIGRPFWLVAEVEVPQAVQIEADVQMDKD